MSAEEEEEEASEDIKFIIRVFWEQTVHNCILKHYLSNVVARNIVARKHIAEGGLWMLLATFRFNIA